MFKNKNDFFSWQGNNLHWWSGTTPLVLSIAVLMLILLWVFKDKIARRFETRKSFWGFKNERWMWLIIGCLMIAFNLMKLIIELLYDYPMRWENIGIHLCVLHFTLIGIFLIINKVEWVKYIMYMSIVGAFFGLTFGHFDSNGVVGPKFTTDPTNEHFPDRVARDPKWSQQVYLCWKLGFTSFYTGWDTWQMLQFLITHLGLIFFPLYIKAAKRLKYTNVEIVRSAYGYFIVAALMWILNVTSMCIPNERWHANNWFIGRDEVNDQKTALGWFSGWPQNYFFYSILGISLQSGLHFIGFATNKVVFFENKKFITIRKSQGYEIFKSDKNWNVFKRAWNFKNH